MQIHERSLTEDEIRDSLRVLRSIPQFGRFSPEEQISILMNLKLASAADGELVCMEGEVGDSMFIIRSGQISIEKSGKTGKHVLVVLDAGTIFGEMSLLDGSPRSASALAEGQAELIVITRSCMDDMALVDEQLACNFLICVIKAACGKITETQSRLINTLGPLVARTAAREA